jgi:FkbM family methyltransferase
VTPGLRSGIYEPQLTRVFERYCRPGMTVVDVGANLGYYSLLASRLVGTAGRVIALEPNSENCRLLLSSLRLNGTANVELLPVAADVATGWAYYSTHVGSNGGLIESDDLLVHPGVVVPTFRLDDLVSGRVDFLKMDVEGAEGRVVRGATGIIERDRPIVTTELKDEMLSRVSEMSVREYLGYFEGLGYRPTLLDKDAAEEKPYPSVDAMLADWGEADELRDVLLVPGSRDTIFPAAPAVRARTLPTGTTTCTWPCSAGPNRPNCSTSRQGMWPQSYGRWSARRGRGRMASTSGAPMSRDPPAPASSTSRGGWSTRRGASRCSVGPSSGSTTGFRPTSCKVRSPPEC